MNMNSPKVSIGMPVYNGEAFIRHALDSLLAQTFTDFELIISDNASTDSTENICTEYAAKDSRIRYVRQNENKGGLFNFQFVLDQAIGKYFMWAAYDDWWDPRFVEILSSVLDNKQDIVIAFCSIILEYIDDNGEIYTKKISQENLDFQVTEKSQAFFNSSYRKYLFQRLGHKSCLIYGLIRRNILSKLPITDWNYEINTDFLYVAVILRYGNVSISPLMLWKKLTHPSSACVTLGRKHKSSTFFQSLIGVGWSFKCKIQYALAIWKVQGNFPNTKKICLLEKLGFTVLEIFKMIEEFLCECKTAFNRRFKT